MARGKFSQPFRVKCERCGNIAESYHRTDKAPKGASIGIASCKCGLTLCDSLGFDGRGRVLFREPDMAKQGANV